ncbi:8217_t:CDS:2 [Ambispora leptoticha]|uniref:8217_t:CDS:1 n=1 Tax=Ambispora leptoticha TaxID=144679 RepID=A0A9N9N747_9GLOM|nr:8217_t:CDS:2 [Ambispora leptoticha]
MAFLFLSNDIDKPKSRIWHDTAHSKNDSPKTKKAPTNNDTNDEKDRQITSATKEGTSNDGTNDEWEFFIFIRPPTKMSEKYERPPERPHPRTQDQATKRQRNIKCRIQRKSNGNIDDTNYDSTTKNNKLNK